MNSSPASDAPRTAPTLSDIEAAARRLAGQAVVTPLLESPLLNAKLGARLLIKAEPLQRTGSFKFRGAYNRISQLTPEQRRRGVVAFSSGNHAQGVAHAAALCETPAVIVMPDDAPAIKIANTRAYGAEVVPYDRIREDREAIGAEIAVRRNLTLVPPYEDFDIIAGQGTVGLEIAEQCRMLGIRPDAVLASCSGGGLIAGVATALKARLPETAIWSVEPAGFDDLARSLRAGNRVSNAGGAKSMCDALLAPMPGELTFAINRSKLTGGLAVSDEEVAHAVAEAFRYFKLVVEPGGAVTIAAVLAGKLAIAGKTIVAIASGGNIDPALFARLVGGAADAA